MDFSTVKDTPDFILIPEGTVVEAVIGKIEAKPGKEDPSKTILHIEFQIAKGEYMFAKISDFITIVGGDAEMLERNKSKIKRMLEYGKDASAQNPHGYVVPEINNEGRKQVKWSDLFGMKAGFQVKLDSFISNKDGKTLYSNKITAYASKNPESGGYKFYDAISTNRQPWQKPLPDNTQPKGKSQPAGMADFEVPIEAYNGDFQ